MEKRIQLIIFLLLILTGQAYAGSVFKFGHILKKSTAHHTSLEWAQKEIKEKFGSAYSLEIYPEGSLGKTDLQVIEGFKQGTTNMAYLSFGHLVELYPPLSIASGPFVFRNFDHWKAFGKSGLYAKLIKEFQDKTGIRSLGIAYYGERHITTKTPLGEKLPLKGLLIRVPGIPVSLKAFRLLEAKPVPIPFHEVYQALEDNLVQAQENPLPTIKAMKFYEPAPVINLTAHITDAQLIVVSENFWQTIPQKDRAALAEIFNKAGNIATEEVRTAEIRLLDEFKKMGITINKLDRTPYINKIKPFHIDNKSFPWKSSIYNEIQKINQLK